MPGTFDFPFPDHDLLPALLAFGEKEEHFCLLDNGQSGKNSWLWMAAIGHTKIFNPEQGKAFSSLGEITRGDWWFGHFAYDLKNETEKLHSAHPDLAGFPLCFFYQPRFIVRAFSNRIEIIAPDQNAATGLFHQLSNFAPETNQNEACLFSARTSRHEYHEAFSQIKKHIARGDIYEINYCIAFDAQAPGLHTAPLYQKLREKTEAPFSAYYRCGHQHLLCASPERYLAKTGKKIISQPIKGTAPRSPNPEEDDQLKTALRNNIKEQSENVMIVDLVRNDLSRVAERGSVRVEELFGIYSFKTVHQMISTVACELDEKFSSADAIRCTFPMGSMTGAPKISAMEIIEKVENTRRGLYSGALGYFTPEGDFDFNVVIRSLQYNDKTGVLSAIAGSAITSQAEAENEYRECLLKAQALIAAAGKLY